jgi:peptidoglycan-N-acetylglucosamine deacetylase
MVKKATIQVDLDGLWTNLQYYGYNHPIENDDIFMSSIPRYLELFDKYNIKATFFLIGKDGEISEKASLVKELHKAGHEIANHTYSHSFGFRKLSYEKKVEEILKGEKVISNLIGNKPVGFKVPGYDMDVETLKILQDNNYVYDSSMIPTFVYPLLMKVNRLMSGGKKRTHGPKWNWMFAPHKLYHPSSKSEIKKGNLSITEFPCSVMPFLRLPYHATFALRFGIPYFKLGYYLTNSMKLPMNYEFHAADLTNDVKDKRLAHLNAVSFDKRIKRTKEVLKTLSSKYDIITSKNFVGGV